ncbi:hypothetical protein [Rhodococcus phenolicus]|uniref:hypothetical protein n=1 Tax=Rhodococcus phenolicus TaxID=263849 RepID=UPI001FDEF589|nr:hypothetical protein [Rhodococcus phenolicus]
MSAIEHPSAVEQEQARQALNALRDVKPGPDTLDVTVAGTAESVRLPSAALELTSWRTWRPAREWPWFPRMRS